MHTHFSKKFNWYHFLCATVLLWVLILICIKIWQEENFALTKILLVFLLVVSGLLTFCIRKFAIKKISLDADEEVKSIRDIVQKIIKTQNPEKRAYHDDWISHGVPQKDIFDESHTYPSRLIDGIKKQAERFGQDFKNITLFFSGGIDSEAMVLGFIEAQVPVKVVFFDFTYQGENNHLDYLHATEFCKRNNLELEIIPFEISEKLIDLYKIDKWSTLDLLFHGQGSPIQNIVFYKYQEENPNETLIVGNPAVGLFIFKRTGNTCSFALNEQTGKYPRVFKFYTYYPDFLQTVYQYHKDHILMQMYPRYNSFKNNVVSELGLFPRPKSNSLDFINNQFTHIGPKDLTRIYKNKNKIWKMLTGSPHEPNALPQNAFNRKSSPLYSFTTSVDFENLSRKKEGCDSCR